MAAEATSSNVENMLINKWYWTNVAANLFDPANPEQKLLVERIKAIEKNMSVESLKQAKALNLCEPVRKEAKQ